MPTTDLPDAIRDALHANEITAADLRQPMLRGQPRTRRGPRIAAAALSAAGVVALVVGITVVANHHGNTPVSGPATVSTRPSVSSVVGYRWAVTQVRDAEGTVAVPAGSGAYIGFTRDGYLLANDTLNPMQANYELTDSGYRVDNAAVGLIGLGPGAESDWLRIIAGIDAVFVPTISDPAPLSVTVRFEGDTLTLSHADVTLTLRKTGAQPDFSSH
jgi:hypothetical protein